MTTSRSPVLELHGAGLALGNRRLWSALDMAVPAGQFLTVLGPNGSGKSSLLKVVLGMRQLSEGSVEINGRPPRRGRRDVGFVPQHRGFDTDTPLRGRDLVQLGVDGHRWGLPARRGSKVVDELLAEIGSEHLADVPVGSMSGGEQQRLRVAQALATDPCLLLCDEPLLSLDPRHQARVVHMLDQRRRDHGTAVVFVTHEINPVLGVTDMILYLLGGRFVLGTPEEVLRSEVLSELYGARVDVVRRDDRVAVLADEAVTL